MPSFYLAISLLATQSGAPVSSLERDSVIESNVVFEGPPRWGIPESLDLLHTGSRETLDAILEKSRIREDVRVCMEKPIGPSERCFHAYSMYALLVSEMAYRGVGWFPDDTGSLCSVLPSMREWVQSKVRERVQGREGGLGNVYNIEPMEMFPLGKIDRICGNRFMADIVLHHRIYRHIWEHGRGGESSFISVSSVFSLEQDIRQLESVPITEILGGRILVEGTRRGYRSWLSRLSAGFSSSELFIPIAGKRTINGVFSSDLSYRTHFKMFGRLCAVSIVDQTPLGFQLGEPLIKLLLAGRGADLVVWDEINDLEGYPEAQDIIRRVRDRGGAMISLVSREPMGSILTESNIDFWIQTAIEEFLYSEHKLAYDALIEGFYEILPLGVFDGGLATPKMLSDLISGQPVDANKLVDQMEFVHPVDERYKEWFRFAFTSEVSSEKFYAAVTGHSTQSVTSIRIHPSVEDYSVEFRLGKLNDVYVPVFGSYKSFLDSLKKFPLFEHPFQPYLFDQLTRPARPLATADPLRVKQLRQSGFERWGKAVCYDYFIAHVAAVSEAKGFVDRLELEHHFCPLFIHPMVYIRTRQELLGIATRRDSGSFEPNIPSMFSLVNLPLVCDLGDDPFTRKAVLYQRIFRRVITQEQRYHKASKARGSGSDRSEHAKWLIASVNLGGVDEETLGKLLATALIDQIPLGPLLMFKRGFYKYLLANSDENIWLVRDLKDEDAEMFAKFESLRDSIYSGSESQSVFFVSLDDPNRELIPGGASIPVDTSRIAQWSQLIVSDFMRSRYPYSSIRDGFYSLLPVGVFDDIMTPETLAELLEGKADISAEELMNLFYASDRRFRDWFIEITTDQSAEWRMQFYRVITGMDHVHVGGFSPAFDYVVDLRLGGQSAVIDQAGFRVHIPWDIATKSQLEHALEHAILGVVETDFFTQAGSPKNMVERERIDHALVGDTYMTFGELAVKLSGLATSSQKAFKSLGGFEIIQRVFACFPNDIPTDYQLLSDSCIEVGVEYSMLISELLSKKTELYETPLSHDPTLLMSRVWSHPLMIQSQVASIQRYAMERDRVSQLQKSSEVEKFPLANLPVAINLCNHPFPLRHTILFHRIRRHILRNSLGGRSVWVVPPTEPVRDSLARLARESVDALLKKIYIQFNDGEVVWGSKAYIKWIVSVWEGVVGEFLVPNPTGTVSINEALANDPALRNFFRGIGRLLALSLIDQIPLGFALDTPLLQLLMRDNEVHTVSYMNPDAQDRYRFTVNAAVTNRPLLFNSLFDGRPLTHEEGLTVDLSNLQVWKRMAVEEYFSRKGMLGHQAIVDGFRDILPKGLFDNVMTIPELRALLSGDTTVDTASFMERIVHARLPEGIEAVIDSIGPELRLRLLRIFTGLNALPYEWSGERIMFIEGRWCDLRPMVYIVKGWEGDWFRDAISAYVPRTGSRDFWAKLQHITKLFNPENIREPNVEPISILETLSLVPHPDLFDLAHIGVVWPQVTSASLAQLEQLGGWEYLNRFVASQESSFTLFDVTIPLFLFGELAELPMDPSDPIPKELTQFVRSTVCPALDYVIDFLARYTQTRRRNRELSRGFSHTRNKFSDDFLVHINNVCDIPNSIVLRSAILFNRLSRAWYSEYTTGTWTIGYHFDPLSLLPLVGLVDATLLANRLEIVYSENSDAQGVGVYRDWFTRMVKGVLEAATLFLRDPVSGVYRVNTQGHQSDSYRAVGRLLGLALIEQLPTGFPINFGLYRWLWYTGTATGGYIWTPEDLLKDDPATYQSWNRTVEHYQGGGADLGMDFSSLEGDVPLLPTTVSSENINEWARLSLEYHMYGRYAETYNSIGRGFLEMLNNQRLLSGVISIDDLIILIGGVSTVSTAELMHEMEFIGIEGREKEWLSEILEEFGNEFRSDFLFFVTGLKSLPPGGFTRVVNHHIQVMKRPELGTHSLPHSHTCFFRIDLPAYPSKQIMGEQLRIAVKETHLLEN
jgi:hypothetical protein